MLKKILIVCALFGIICSCSHFIKKTSRFTDNGDGTIKDNITGLIWLKNVNCDGSKDWNDANDFCNLLASGSCGLTDGSLAGDWRLPTLSELKLWQWDEKSKSGHPFTGGKFSVNDQYWSGTDYTGHDDGAWCVVYGRTGNPLSEVLSKRNKFYVWPVRDDINVTK